MVTSEGDGSRMEIAVEFSELKTRALEVREQYAAWEARKYGRSWTPQEIALGFVGDVGDLAKLVLAQSGVRELPGAIEKLAHELSDCLWSLIVLADTYQVDLEAAFLETMDALEAHLRADSGGAG